MKKTALLITGVLCLCLIAIPLYAQTIENVDGVRVVKNGKKGKFDNNPVLSLTFSRALGQIDHEDDNFLFYMPSDIVVDRAGNIYVMDSGNHRIQKFDKNMKYVATFGEEGEGPAEFTRPLSIDLDNSGKIYVSDQGNLRIQILTPEGKNFKTIPFDDNPGAFRLSKNGLFRMGGGGFNIGMGMRRRDADTKQPDLIRVISQDGKVVTDYSERNEYNDFMLNRFGNRFEFTVDSNDNTYVAFDVQNRIEKYSPDGKLLMKIERALNYDVTTPLDKGDLEESGNRQDGEVRMRAPDMNQASSGIAVDNKGRIWVVNLRRQLKDNEEVGIGISAESDGSGRPSIKMSLMGNTEVQETDAYQLEVYDRDGILLQKFPLNHFVDNIRIFDDKVYLLDQLRGMQFREYVISEK